jgi:hypothetical protein
LTYAFTDAETPTEMMDRLIGMASGHETWDLSDNDQAAIQYAIDRIAQLEYEVANRDAALESERLSRKQAERTVERFGQWLDCWSTSGASRNPSEVYGAWDRAREDK